MVWVLLDDEMEAMFIFDLIDFRCVDRSNVPLGNQCAICDNFLMTGFART